MKKGGRRPPFPVSHVVRRSAERPGPGRRGPGGGVDVEAGDAAAAAEQAGDDAATHEAEAGDGDVLEHIGGVG